jgi:hypothetical protein
MHGMAWQGKARHAGGLENISVGWVFKSMVGIGIIYIYIYIYNCRVKNLKALGLAPSWANHIFGYSTSPLDLGLIKTNSCITRISH